MVKVLRQSPRTWGVYVNGELVEGGFFWRDSALAVALVWRARLEA